MSSRPQWPGPTQITLPKLPKIPGQLILWVILAIAALVALSQMFYTVQPEEEAIVLRLGRWTGETHPPGLHWKLPFIDRVFRVPTQRQLKEEFGFRTREPGVRTEYIKQGHSDESLMLTGDLNVGDVEWIVQFKIRDAYQFLFKVQDPIGTFRDMTEASMRHVVGDHSVDEVLTIGRTKIAADAKDYLQELCNRYEIGIGVEQLVLQDVNPPDAVKPSFNEVNEAIQERERLINEAWATYNKAVPRARGEAEQQIRRAEGYELERVNNAEGEASRFLAVYDEYRKAPAVTRQRLYLETIEAILPRLGDKIVVDERLETLLPLMNLGGAPRLPAKSPAEQGGGR
ncbi:MAG: FtsH protease activity modulator HflK [Acidobacteriota bacterium]|nr:MAG: FtsH protease activity modulator HflK [Acidobacteriota bacterium]